MVADHNDPNTVRSPEPIRGGLQSFSVSMALNDERGRRAISSSVDAFLYGYEIKANRAVTQVKIGRLGKLKRRFDPHELIFSRLRNSFTGVTNCLALP